jgi:hypothetical protein
LRADARKILVASEGLIWLPESNTPDQPASVNDRLARLLSCLSQEMALAGNVSVRMINGDSGALISVKPSHAEQLDLSRFYDTASAAAALCNGLLFIGQNRMFIRYRDADAPRGYNATAIQSPPAGTVYLVDRGGTHVLSHTSLREVNLSDLLLRILPVPTHSKEAPTVLFVLALPALCDILVRYFRDHYLSFRIARMESESGQALTLLEVKSRPDSPTGTRVPPYVLSYLCGLPHTVVCTALETTSERWLLVQWQHRYPCLARNVVEVFNPDSLILLAAGPYFSNLCVSPVPPFFEGDQLTSIRMMPAKPTTLVPLADWRSRPFELPVRLMPDSGPLLPTAALVLKMEEIDWVRRLLHKLPAEAFAEYNLCLGQDSAVLLATTTPLESLPFGIPFRRVEDTNLFVPLRMRFAPALPWPLLASVLEVKEEAYTFFAEEFRLDVPRDSFAPLSRALVADANPPRSSFELRPAPVLPNLKWTPPRRPEAPPKVSPPARDRLRMLRESGGSFIERAFGRTSGARQNPPAGQARPTTALDSELLFKDRAEFYLRAGDHLSAALCFALAGDNYNAAQYYQAAARQIRGDRKNE